MIMKAMFNINSKWDIFAQSPLSDIFFVYSDMP